MNVDDLLAKKSKMELKIITAPELIPSMFEIHPLWAEYDEPEDLDDIVSWGYDRESTKKELLNKFKDQQHPYYTVPLNQFPPSNIRFFTLSDLITKNGKKLKGAVMNHGELIIEIFLDENRSVTLSCHPALYDLNKAEIIKTALELDLDLLELTEINFRTIVVDQEGLPIEGIFRIMKET